MQDPIEELLSGREEPFCAHKNELVRDTLNKMIEHDFSQLPIVDDEGMLIGMISETSITRNYFHLDNQVDLLDLSVDHCLEEAVTLTREDANLFEILERLKSVYAVVITSQRKPVGIVTDFDTTHFFRDWSEGLMRVQSIELTLRQYIEDLFTTEKALEAALYKALGGDKIDPLKPRKSYDELSFADHLSVITYEGNWGKFEPYLKPKNLFRKMMEPVNQVRNQLAHFRGNMETIQADALIRAQTWLANRPRFKPKGEKPIQTAVVDYTVELNDSLVAEHGKYFPLQAWLKDKVPEVNSGYEIEVSFADIEKLIKGPLPDSARVHRAWWSNDASSKYRQSMAWMKAGWLVENVDQNQEVVSFKRTDSVLYQLFFADLLEKLREVRPSLTRARKTYLQNWFGFSGGRTGLEFGWTILGSKELNVFLYINMGDTKINNKVFDTLKEDQEAIEKEIGYPVNWERRDHTKTTRISALAAKDVDITASDEELEEAKKLALDAMLKFVDCLKPRVNSISI